MGYWQFLSISLIVFYLCKILICEPVLLKICLIILNNEPSSPIPIVPLVLLSYSVCKDCFILYSYFVILSTPLISYFLPLFKYKLTFLRDSCNNNSFRSNDNYKWTISPVSVHTPIVLFVWSYSILISLVVAKTSKNANTIILKQISNIKYQVKQISNIISSFRFDRNILTSRMTSITQMQHPLILIQLYISPWQVELLLIVVRSRCWHTFKVQLVNINIIWS